MITFPKELGSFLLADFSHNDGKYFDDIDNDYLFVNKKANTKRNNIYNVSLTFCEDEFIKFQEFGQADLYDFSEAFNVEVLKDGERLFINCFIISKLNITYKENRTFVKFSIVENYIV